MSLAVISLDQVTAYGTAAIVAVLAAIDKWRTTKRATKTDEEATLVSEAKMYRARGDDAISLAEEYRQRLAKEHQEFNDYRKFQHEKAKEDQAKMFSLSEEITKLNMKPDYGELFEHVKGQTEMQVKVLQGIESIAQSIKDYVTCNIQKS